MADPVIGGYHYFQETECIKDELHLLNRLMDKLSAGNLDPENRMRLRAEIAFAINRALKSADTLERIGREVKVERLVK